MTTQIEVLILDEDGFEPELEATLSNELGQTRIFHTENLDDFKEALKKQLWKIIIINFKSLLFSEFHVSEIKKLTIEISSHVGRNAKLFAYPSSKNVNSFFSELGFFILKKITDKTVLRKGLSNKEKNLNPSKVTLEAITAKASLEMFVSVNVIKTKKRKRMYTKARQIAIYLCVRYTDLSLAEIGDFFRGRDHTTIIHSYWAAKDQIDTDEEYKKLVYRIADKIEQEFDCSMLPERLIRNCKNKKLLKFH
jgi:hypothetical protein